MSFDPKHVVALIAGAIVQTEPDATRQPVVRWEDVAAHLGMAFATVLSSLGLRPDAIIDAMRVALSSVTDRDAESIMTLAAQIVAAQMKAKRDEARETGKGEMN